MHLGKRVPRYYAIASWLYDEKAFIPLCQLMKKFQLSEQQLSDDLYRIKHQGGLYDIKIMSYKKHIKVVRLPSRTAIHISKAQEQDVVCVYWKALIREKTPNLHNLS